MKQSSARSAAVYLRISVLGHFRTNSNI